MTESDPDEALGRALSTLGNAVRIRLLRVLREPLTLGEIKVVSEHGARARPLARQSVREHLDRMVEIGVVLSRGVDRPGGATQEFVANHQAVFALADQFQALARLRPTVEPSVPTAGASGRKVEAIERPCFVLVKGLEEGRVFPLVDGGPRFVIGRRRDCAVSLDYDPYVSTENTLVTAEGGHHAIEDLPSSRNGTLVNLRTLVTGERRRLHHGDLVGVGRSTLVYWA